MRILLVTDGKYPEYVNGVSIYVRYLAEEMVKREHDVFIFHHIKSGWLKRPKIVRAVENHIKYYGVDNSPVSFSEALVHPLNSHRERITEMLFLSILENVNPDIVHFHEFQRTPSYCINIAKSKRLPTVVTLHDYWFICPRLQLFTLDKRICGGPAGGRNCVTNCVSADYATRQYRKMIMLLPDGPLLRGIKKVRNMYKQAKGENLGQISSRTTMEKKNYLGLRERDRRLAEAFGQRETCLKRCLSKADLILAVSNCVKDVFMRHGIGSNRIVVNQLGVKSVDWLKKKIGRFEHYPIRFGFLGHLGPVKGAQLIVAAAKKISTNKAKFLFFGSADDETLYDFKQSTRGLMNCKYMGKYDYRRLDDVFNCFDILIIPSISQETLALIGLEAQAAGIPVIASDIGGMKDYIQQAINGSLFEPGNVNQLKSAVQSFIDNPNLIKKFSRQAVVPKSISENAVEILHYYQEFGEGG